MKYAVGCNMVSFGCRMTLFKRCKSWLGRFVRSKYEEDECYDVNNAQSLDNIYGFLILDRIGRVFTLSLKDKGRSPIPILIHSTSSTTIILELKI